MTYNVIISPNAEEDIDQIITYLKKDLFNLKAAQNFYNEMLNQIENICLFPKSGTMLLSRKNNRMVRKVLIGNYIMFYEVNEQIINILRIRYGGSDIVI